jgi:hypothetical protein
VANQLFKVWLFGAPGSTWEEPKRFLRKTAKVIRAKPSKVKLVVSGNEERPAMIFMTLTEAASRRPNLATPNSLYSHSLGKKNRVNVQAVGRPGTTWCTRFPLLHAGIRGFGKG